ncbi:MAG: hypothetical protein SGPRY_006805, partial [Prymnesium sp.]
MPSSASPLPLRGNDIAPAVGTQAFDRLVRELGEREKERLLFHRVCDVGRVCQMGHRFNSWRQGLESPRARALGRKMEMLSAFANLRRETTSTKYKHHITAISQSSMWRKLLKCSLFSWHNEASFLRRKRRSDLEGDRKVASTYLLHWRRTARRMRQATTRLSEVSEKGWGWGILAQAYA